MDQTTHESGLDAKETIHMLSYINKWMKDEKTAIEERERKREKRKQIYQEL